jgi:hypothetical protein
MKTPEKIQPELIDILEAIRRYSVVHKPVCFVGAIVSLGCVCEKCSKSGEEEIKINPEASRLFAFGYQDNLKEVLKGLEEMVDKNTDEDEFVNI